MANPYFRRELGGDLPGETPQRNDDEILRDLESILFYDDLIRSYEVKIDVQDGIVTLSGVVSNDVERHRAVEDARRVHGVKKIVDNIEIGRVAGL